ncbi:MAG: sigma-54-dependent Fis family transcriptional regulator [Planctomycetes bacterium]|nr:sigma-54-dependent Fis family transcriptional regulator [Planctomycetota bacterium]
MAEKKRILVVDDDPLITRSLAALLRREGYEVATAPDGLEALARLERFAPDVVLADVHMPRRDGLALLDDIRAHDPELPVIMITGFGTIDNAVQAIQRGAHHYVTKPLQDDEIRIILARTLEQKRLRAERQQLKRENDHLKRRLRGRFTRPNIIGRDPRMRAVFEVVEAVASTRTTVLITGESGTGKTLVARAIHYASNRAERPFVEVNCGALPETLLESELFGHARGAFTGAVQDRTGKFELAHGGTVFLDEIGNASPAFQVKLLRVLQDREFERIGQHETVQVDVRVVLATHMDLGAAVRNGTFREDLYYRINVVTVELPPLRERLADLELLASLFLEKYAAENRKPVAGFVPAALARMRAYPWPGNVRELENVIERAVVLTKHPEIRESDLPPPLFGTGGPVAPPLGEILSLKDALALPEKQIIERALREHRWNRQKTAVALKVNRTTLFNKMRKYGLLGR